MFERSSAALGLAESSLFSSGRVSKVSILLLQCRRFAAPRGGLHTQRPVPSCRRRPTTDIPETNSFKTLSFGVVFSPGQSSGNARIASGRHEPVEFRSSIFSPRQSPSRFGSALGSTKWLAFYRPFVYLRFTAFEPCRPQPPAKEALPCPVRSGVVESVRAGIPLSGGIWMMLYGESVCPRCLCSRSVQGHRCVLRRPGQCRTGAAGTCPGPAGASGNCGRHLHLPFACATFAA